MNSELETRNLQRNLQLATCCLKRLASAIMAMDLFRQNLGLELIRPDWNNLPSPAFPPGYSLRWFHTGDAAHWLRIHHDADPFNEISPELFTRQFGTDLKRLESCQCFVQDELGRVVGTGTAWTDATRADGLWGRVYWLAILRQYQGRGLGKPLLAAVCNRLRESGHTRARVLTSTGRLPAVALYLSFGFQPEVRTEADRAVWEKVLATLRERGRGQCEIRNSKPEGNSQSEVRSGTGATLNLEP